MYCSSECLAAANAVAHIHRHIDCNMHKAPYFKGKRGRKAQVAIRDHAMHVSQTAPTYLISFFYFRIWLRAASPFTYLTYL